MRTAVCVGLLALLAASCGKEGGQGGEVVVRVSERQLAELKSWPSDIACFTSRVSPIQALEHLRDGEFAVWGMELVPQVQKLLALGGRADTPVGFSIIATGNENAKFEKNPTLRLFVTYESLAKDILDGGGVRIRFEKK
jgi:hypothetical protein